VKARNNPYRSDRVLGIRYRFQAADMDEFLLRLENHGYRGAIVGPEGSGKTTLLEDLQAPLRKRGKSICWFRLTLEFPRFSAEEQRRIQHGFQRDEIILLDGAETLGWLPFQWFRFQTRKAGGLIITAHKPGYLATLLKTRTSAPLLGSIMSDLDPQAPADLAEGLFLKYRGNLREALREMYDLRAVQPE